MKFQSFFLLFLLAGNPLTTFAQPVDNPVETRYGSGMYTWTNQIQWSQVVNIHDYGGTGDGINPNDAAFVQARDALVALGGGILYFPAGTYVFTDSIGLKDNVVLRGDDPVVGSATDPDYRPSSKLVFPKFNFVASGSGTDPGTAFKSIGMASGQTGINTGFVNVDINRASIFAGGYGTESENVVIFGIRSNNVAQRQSWTVPTPEQEDWQIHPNRFASNISAFAYRNVLVANCMVNDAHYWLHRQDDGKDMTGAPTDLGSLEIDDFEQPGYLIKDGTVWRSVEAVFGGSVPGAVYVFDYTNHYGINVQGSTGEWGAPPWVQPNLFYSGAVIRDNWVYCTMRVKIDSSGRGLVVKDNILKDRSGKRYLVDPNGTTKVQNAATLENRGIDWRGHDVLIEGNEIEVFRHLLGTGPYSSVDGEGILHQEVHGTTIDGLVIRNNTANAYIGIWKMPYTRNVLIEDNTLTGAGYIIVESDTNGADFPMYNVLVQNNNLGSKGVVIRADYFSPGILSADVRDNLLDGTLEIEDHAVHFGNTKLDGSTPAAIDTKAGAVAIDPPAEGILFADADPDAALSGETVNFTVLVTTPSVNVERVEFYRHKTLIHTDETPPYTYSHVADGTRALWSAKVEQPEQVGGYEPYAALLIKDAPGWVSPPSVELTSPDPAGTYILPTNLVLTASVVPGASSIARVEFYEDGTFLGADADGLAPFTFTWAGAPRGIHSLTAKVWDVDDAVVVSDPVEIEVEGPPDSSPADFSAVPYSDTEIDLSWTNTADNAEGFDVERSPAGLDSWSFVDSVDLAVTAYRDGGLDPETAYDYRVRATNVHGVGPFSATASATTLATAPAAPGIPGAFTARSLNDTRMGLIWLGSAGAPFGYRLEYRFAEVDSWIALGNAPASATEFFQAGLPPDARIHYRIQSWNNAGSSPWSETIGATLAVGFNETFSSEGDPWSIPGRIEFEDYNVTAGYWDSDSGNNGSASYRFPDSVDIGTGGSGLTIGWIRNGEWLEFTVIVGTAGLYDIDIRYASPNSGGSLILKLDGNDLATAVVFPNTGDWGAYQTLSYGQVYLPAGHHLLRSVVVNEGFNLDYMEFTLAEAATYASWQQAYLPAHPLSGATDNADSDAYLNEFDMLFGLDPLAGDAPQTQAGIDNGLGMLVFPLAKGLESVSWTLNYSHDLGQGGGWTGVAPGQLHVLAEDPDRMWMRAEVPLGLEDAVFFQFEIVP